MIDSLSSLVSSVLTPQWGMSWNSRDDSEEKAEPILFPEYMILLLTAQSLPESSAHCKQLDIKVTAQSGCHQGELKPAYEQEFLFQHPQNGILNV